MYVIVRGSTNAIMQKKEYGNIPIVGSTFYDGREFGESTLYQVSENLTEAMVKELNQQKYTCEAMEPTYILALDKQDTMRRVNQGLHDEFEHRITFLSQISLFHGIDLHILLPLAHTLQQKTYKLGEFVLREGQTPPGLYIVTKGRLRVGSQ